MIRNVRIVTVEPQDPSAPSAASVCESELRRQLPMLRYPAVQADPAPGDPPGAPYDIEFVPNPKAWGNFPTTQPIKFQVPRDRAQMHTRLRAEAEAAFAIGGWPLIDELAAGAFGKQQLFALRMRKPGRPLGTSMMEELREHVSPERAELFRMFDVVRGELQKKAAAGLSLLQSHALCRAINEELPRCEDTAISEARRYLSLARTDERSVRAALAAGYPRTYQALIGPEGPALVSALGSLRGPYTKMQESQKRYEDTLPGKNLQKAAIWMLLGAVALPVVIMNQAEAVRKAFGPQPARQQALLQLAQATAAFQAEFAALALRYPILFKIADLVGKDEGEWSNGTVAALQDALTASADLQEALREDPEKVWRFPGLIDRSIRAGFGPHTSFMSRVASDKLLKENDMPPFARLNAGIQLLSTTLMLVPLPPVKVGLAIAMVIGDAAELLESYFRTKEQRMGFRAAIDPADALGADASYASTVIQAGFLALDVLPIPGAVKEWAEESAKAKRAAALREASLNLAP